MDLKQLMSKMPVLSSVLEVRNAWRVTASVVMLYERNPSSLTQSAAQSCGLADAAMLSTVEQVTTRHARSLRDV